MTRAVSLSKPPELFEDDRSASQGDRVIWGWALATLVFGMACVWLVLVLHRVIQRADQRAALRRTAEQSR